MWVGERGEERRGYACFQISGTFALRRELLKRSVNGAAITSASSLSTGWERTGQMLCIVDTSLSVLMTLRMCLHELCCLFTVWI